MFKRAVVDKRSAELLSFALQGEAPCDVFDLEYDRQHYEQFQEFHQAGQEIFHDRNTLSSGWSCGWDVVADVNKPNLPSASSAFRSFSSHTTSTLWHLDLVELFAKIAEYLTCHT